MDIFNILIGRVKDFFASPHWQTYLLVLVSVSAVAVPLIVGFVDWLRRLQKKKDLRNRKSTLNRILTASGCVALAVFCMRYAVGLAYKSCWGVELDVLSGLEELGNSFLHTLQTFSMDENYTGYHLAGQKMIEEAFGGNESVICIYNCYNMLLNMLAPVFGGAAIFEILADLFPQFKLWTTPRFKRIFYFSELNEMSLALARSIVVYSWRNVIVFTDTYKDDDNEKKSELLAEAEKVGAICLKQDLAHVHKRRCGDRMYMLIDENEVSNLQTLAALSEEENYRSLKNARILLFTNDNAYVQLEKALWDKLKNEYHLTQDQMPSLMPVKIYRNIVVNILRELPLYEPLIGKEKNADGTVDLTVSIVGTGLIGTEMFLTTYWIGQILGCNLKINLVSQESEDSFWSKIDYINPEIRRTLDPKDSILQINSKGEMSPVYATVNYTQCDVRSSEFVKKLQSEKTLGNLLDTDYFLVALGTDDDNISVANTIKMYVGQHRVASKKKKHTAMAYVVYDPNLADALNQTKWHAFVDEDWDLYMSAVGSLDDVFSVRNVFMLDSVDAAVKVGQKYVQTASKSDADKQTDVGKKKDRLFAAAQIMSEERTKNNEYNFWASLARGEHFWYKVFSLGLFEQSLWDMLVAKPENHTEKSKQELMEQSRKLLWEQRENTRGKFKAKVVPVETADAEAMEKQRVLLAQMQWAEHRRWNAFSRVYGLRGTKDWKSYLKFTGNHKHMELKLHPCLVECDRNGIRAEVKPKSFKCKEDEAIYNLLAYDEPGSQLDLLDELCEQLQNCEVVGYEKKEDEFKLFDYPHKLDNI